MYRVLLIDDERLVLASLRRRIDWEACGFSVCGEAFNGKDGLSKIEELHPDLVFTDIRMPGISGLDLIGQAQKEFPSVRFVVISGYSEFEYAKRAIEYGVLGFCVKPFDEEEIHGLLQGIFGSSSTPGEAERSRGLLFGLSLLPGPGTNRRRWIGSF